MKLPKHNETTLIYDTRVKSHNEVFTGELPSKPFHETIFFDPNKNTKYHLNEIVKEWEPKPIEGKLNSYEANKALPTSYLPTKVVKSYTPEEEFNIVCDGIKKTTKAIFSSIQQYSAVYDYVDAVSELPPTYHSDELTGCGQPDMDFVNDDVLQSRFDTVEEARENVKKVCGFDPSKHLY